VDDFLNDVLEGIDPVKKRRIINNLVLVKVGTKYYYVAFNLPKKIVSEMLQESGFENHLFQRRYQSAKYSKMKSLTMKVIESLDFISIHQTKKQVSGIYIESHEALCFILKKLI
jgi:hypothetical protein